MAKGKQVNIPASGFTDIDGNVSELGDVSRCPGKSSLFFLTTATRKTLESYCMEIGFEGR